MALYTFFLDYQGGTYLSQARAETFHDAAKVWAEEGDFEHIAKVGSRFQDELLTSIESEKPVQIEGLAKTWCLTFTIADELALVHFTQTAE